jgi:hypothetical protein
MGDGFSDRTPPRGWRVVSSTLVPDPTVTGYIGRGCEVKGVCHLRDCRRRCELDLPRLVQRGYGSVAVTDLIRLYRCNRVTGCALDFHEEHGAEITLSTLAGRDHVWIKLTCGKYRHHVLATAA